MKICPRCSEEYTESELRFCLKDGTTLVKKESNPLVRFIGRLLSGNKPERPKYRANEGYADYLERTRTESMSPEENKEYRASKLHLQKDQSSSSCRKPCFDHGPLREKMICPHCHEKSCVHSRVVKVKKGISGSKATGAILTGGISILATGLSRKEEESQAYCHNCKARWSF